MGGATRRGPSSGTPHHSADAAAAAAVRAELSPSSGAEGPGRGLGAVVVGLEGGGDSSGAPSFGALLLRVVELQSENIRLREELDAARKESRVVAETLREKTELLNLILEKDRRHTEQVEEQEYAFECFASHIAGQSETLDAYADAHLPRPS